MGRKSAYGSGIWDEKLGSYFLELRNHFFDADLGSGIRNGDRSDPGSGMEKSRIRDRGSGIRDKHPGSVTLVYVVLIAPYVECPPVAQATRVRSPVEANLMFSSVRDTVLPT
jgi:hypothetical protein